MPDRQILKVFWLIQNVNICNTCFKTAKTLANSPPQTTVRSACIEPGESTVKVLWATGVWWSCRMVLSQTLLLYCWIYIFSYINHHPLRRTSTFSVRVPVWFSLFCPTIGEFVCFAYGCRRMKGLQFINGGADLFEFSIDGIIKRNVQTESFKLLRWKGQIVSVRTRYGKFDEK
jgi:hypothetical protein